MQLFTLLVTLVWTLPFTYAQPETLISAEALRAELDFIVQTIEEVHPGPYTRVSEEVFKVEIERVQAALNKPLTSAQFYELVAPLVSSLQDGHTQLASEASLGERPCRAKGLPRFFTAESKGVLVMPSFGVDNSSATREEVRSKLADYARFIEEAFRTFKEKEVAAVAIDVRENSGGDSRVGEMIIQYLTGDPYRAFARVDAKVSEQSRAWERRLRGNLPEDFERPLGTIIRYDAKFITPDPNPLHFNGKVYVLTSACTASAATGFAATIKDFELGVVVGEETGGLPTDFGDYIVSKLPETNLELRVSYKYFVRPGGFDDGRGVLPDVDVPASRALQWVLSHAQ